MQHESPRATALRILSASFGADAHTPPPRPGLEAFQLDAVVRLRSILCRRGGAILGDSVGLGKTHVAAALIRDEVAAGASILVTAPAQLRAHWSRHLRGAARWRWLSHTSLSRGVAASGSRARLVVVDEAHAFRNPRTRRYASLALLCESSRVLLLTATPVNNSLLDFYNLVRLFAARDQFIDIGVPDLLGAVESALHGGSAADIRRVVDAVMVRRTRAMVTAGAASSRLRFPSCGPIERIRYDGAQPEELARVLHVISALRFPAHASGDGAARELMRLGLLKRLESSTAALHASLRRHIRLLEHFVSAARAGLLFDPRGDSGRAADVDGAAQLSLDPLTLAPWPPARDRAAAIADAERDLVALRELLRDTGTLLCDSKLTRLRVLLDGALAHETVLLFTEYQETARALWRALSCRPGVGMVHGSDARLGRGRSTRRAVIERFAPIANHARLPRAVERVRLLIATDVLAEGLNLQDARVVISYDMPWNPVRLAQRIGRIDRLGSPHEHIRALSFVPDRDVDELLGLMRRVRRKLRHIRIVGGDAPWSLGSTRERSRVLDRLDADSETREAARARFVAVAHSRTSLPGDPPAAGIMSWKRDREGALCCFRRGADTVLVLIQEERPSQIGAAACWSVLIDALDAGDDSSAHDAAAATARIEAAVCEAHRVLSVRRQPSPAAPPERGATLAGAAVLRWLAQLPGGAAPEDARIADTLLRQLRTGSRAGTDARIERLVRSARSSAGLIEDLLRILPELPHTSATRTGTVAGASSSDRADTAEIVAVLLLLPCSRPRENPTGNTPPPVDRAARAGLSLEARRTFPRSSVGRAGDC